MRTPLLFAAVAVFVFAGCDAAGQDTAPVGAAPGSYRVVRVVDGDTIVVDIDGVEVTSRGIGMDTPEVVQSDTPKMCFGQEASDRAHQLLDDQWVTLTADPSQDAIDKYGRRLDYWTTADGTDVAQTLIAEGFAVEYTYDVAYAHQAAHLAAQESARAANAGLWSPDTCGGNHELPAGQAPVPAAGIAPIVAAGAPSPDACDAAYPGVCIAPVAAAGDLDCGDIADRKFVVVAPDPHNFDGDLNGVGCES